MSATPAEIADLRRCLYASGAKLLALALLTGIWAAATLTGMVAVALPRLGLGAHLAGLMGAFWIFAVASSLECLNYDARQLRRLRNLLYVANWGNWSVTLLGSFLGVSGLAFNHDPANNLIAGLLQMVVVLPSLGAAGMWMMGFRTPTRA